MTSACHYDNDYVHLYFQATYAIASDHQLSYKYFGILPLFSNAALLQVQLFGKSWKLYMWAWTLKLHAQEMV